MKLQSLASFLLPAALAAAAAAAADHYPQHQNQQPTYHSLPITAPNLGDFNISYVEAGDPQNPTLVLLHGFPSSINQWRHFIPLLSDSYHIIAPDLPGFGHTQVPSNFSYTFENLALATETFLSTFEDLPSYSLYVFDYGAPVGWYLALNSSSSSSSSSASSSSSNKQKKKIDAIISQNGNAYTIGLGAEFWAPIKKLWAAAAEHNATATRIARDQVASSVLTFAGTREQYTMGQEPSDLALLDPNTWTLDYETNIRGGRGANVEKQLDLFTDYASNVAMYPEVQKWFKESKVPILAVWGARDPCFVAEGAVAFEEDLGKEQVRVKLVEGASHFALETRLGEVVGEVRGFLGGLGL